MGWGEGARVGRGGAGAHMCSRGCCCWSANDVWRCRLRKLSLGDLGLVSENAPWRLTDLADVTLCKSPSLGRVAMVETGLESGCGRGDVSAFNLRLASRRVDWRSWVFSSFSLLDRLSRARLWWNMPRRCHLGAGRNREFPQPSFSAKVRFADSRNNCTPVVGVDDGNARAPVEQPADPSTSRATH